MKVITNAPIYSSADAKTYEATVTEVKGKSKEEVKALKDAEKARIKQQRLQDRTKLKEERDSRLAQKKQERQTRRADRKAKRNAKRLLRLRDKTGKEKIFYPLTRLRRNQKNQIVKVYPDGTETIVKQENVVSITTQEITPSGPKSVTTELDKTEVAKALNVAPSQVTPELVQVKTTEIKKEEAPVQAQETKTTQFENVVAVEITPENVVTDAQGNDVLATETQDVTATDVNLVDENKKNNDEESKGLSLTAKIAIGVVSATLLGIIGYMIYKTSKSK
jgi:hypothetical protein